MEEMSQGNAVRNVFRNGRMPTREEYTDLWIRMIRQLEQAKAEKR